MKTILHLLSSILVLFSVTGCNTPTVVSAHTDGTVITSTITNQNVGVGASYNTVTDEWTGGVWISFTKEPNRDTVDALVRAGAVAVTPKTWRLNYHTRDITADHPAFQAINAVLRNGGSITTDY